MSASTQENRYQTQTRWGLLRFAHPMDAKRHTSDNWIAELDMYGQPTRVFFRPTAGKIRRWRTVNINSHNKGHST